MTSSSTSKRLLSAIAAAGLLGLVALLGWRMVVGTPSSQSATTSEQGETTGELVPLVAQAGVELRLLGWQHTPEVPGVGVAGDSEGAAVALATLRNVDARWTEFIVDVAAVDAEGQQILGFGTAQVSDLPAGGLGALTLTIPAGVPGDAKLGIANLWARTPGDPQIHPINFADPAAAEDQTPAQPTTMTEADLMDAASRFAASLAAMQQQCRTDNSLAGLVCLSRRNFPDYLLEPASRLAIAGRPFFHQEVDPSGPPRAFDLTASADVVACVGQRIDKQTSDQVAILGSCSQRGLYPGNGDVRAPMSAVAALPPLPPEATRSSTPVGTGGLPGSPVAFDERPADDPGPAGIGDSVDIGTLQVTVDGVQVGISRVPGLPPAVATYSLITVSVTNSGTTPVNLADYSLTIGDAGGSPLALVANPQGTAYGWPPQPSVVAAGDSLNTTVVLEVADDQTATTATFEANGVGQRVSISLLPPPT